MLPNRKALRESPEAAKAAPPPSEWAPFGSAGDFGKNVGIAISALFIALALAFVAGSLFRRYLHQRRRRQQTALTEEKPAPAPPVTPIPEEIPAVVFSAREGWPAEAEAECAICLVEFADGDAIRVLPNCVHEFHVGCIDMWIDSRRSCPTCRKSSLPLPEKLVTETEGV